MNRDTTRAEVTIREAGEDDAASVHGLVRELANVVGDAHPLPENVRARLLELMEEPRAETLVAEAGGEVVGVVSYWIKPDLAHGDTVAEIPMLAVSEAHRRTGAGSALVDEMRRRAAKRGATLVELVTTPANVAAREFYRSLGFVETDHLVLELVAATEGPEPR